VATETILGTALVTLEEAQVYLKRPSGTEDEIITRLINYCTAKIEQHTRRHLKTTAYTSTTKMVMNGSGDSSIECLEYPVTALAGAERLIDDVSTWQALDITGARFSSRGLIYLPRDFFPKGFRNVRLDVTAGILTSSVEWKGLVVLTLRYVQVAYQDYHLGRGRGTSIGAAGETVNLIDKPIPPDIAKELLPYQRWM
jgi:hypothetical protein